VKPINFLIAISDANIRHRKLCPVKETKFLFLQSFIIDLCVLTIAFGDKFILKYFFILKLSLI